MNGNELFRDAAGVGITECESVEEITARVRSVSNRASRALAVLVKVCREAFPVCMEGFEEASTTQPCFHVVCGAVPQQAGVNHVCVPSAGAGCPAR